jgi:hypothetical protein
MATVRADGSAIRETTVLFTHWRQAAQSHLRYLRLIGLRLIRIPIRPIRMGTSSGLLLDNFDPALPWRNDPS